MISRTRFGLLTLLIFSGLTTYAFFYFKNQSVSHKLQLIPVEEQFLLEAFFRTLISVDNGSYVLFGDKPASLMVYEDGGRELFQVLPDFELNVHFYPAKRGFEIWQKFQHLFPSKVYVLVRIESCFSKALSAIFLIHKDRLLATLSKYFSDFQRRFPKFQSPEELLNSMLIDPSLLQQVCNKHDLLLGIILGYGKENAALFERKINIEAFLSPKKFYPFRSSLNNSFFRPTAREGFITLEEELNVIKMKSDGIIEDLDSPGISWNLHYPLGYLVDPEKTDLNQLRANLKQVLVKSTAAYEKGDFLHVTLKKIINGN
jgi:hypothetical protein